MQLGSCIRSRKPSFPHFFDVTASTVRGIGHPWMEMFAGLITPESLRLTTIDYLLKGESLLSLDISNIETASLNQTQAKLENLFLQT